MLVWFRRNILDGYWILETWFGCRAAVGSISAALPDQKAAGVPGGGQGLALLPLARLLRRRHRPAQRPRLPPHRGGRLRIRIHGARGRAGKVRIQNLSNLVIDLNQGMAIFLQSDNITVVELQLNFS